MRALTLALVGLLAMGACTTTKSDVKAAGPTRISFEPMVLGPKKSSRAPSAEAYRASLLAEIRATEGDAKGAADLFEEALIHDDKSAYLWTRLGELRVKLGDTSGAHEAADQALGRAPKSHRARMLLALCEVLGGDKTRAKKILRAALEDKKGDRDASSFLAELLLENGELKEAESVIAIMMENAPADIDGYVTLARLFVERGDIEAAERYVDKALDRDERAAAALQLKLDLVLAAGRYEGALVVVDRLAAERGDSPGMRQLLMTVRVLSGQVVGAEELARAWLQEDPSETTIGVVAGAWESAGKRARARKTLDEHTGGALTGRMAIEAGRLAFDAHDDKVALRLLCGVRADEGDPDYYAFARALCARAELRVGEPRRAVAAIKTGLVHAPENWRLYSAWIFLARSSPEVDFAPLTQRLEEALASALKSGKEPDLELIEVASRAVEDAGDRARAREILDDSLRRRAEDPDRLILLARHLERQGKGRQAVQIIEDLMDRHTPTLEMLNFAAFTLADIDERPDDATRYGWRALLRGPLNGYVLDTLGWALFRNKKLDEAEAALARANVLSPDEPEILFHLGVVQNALGRAEAARKTTARALQLCPKFEPFFPRLEALAAELGVS